MKVLLADFDLYSSTGGGQTSYRTLISRNPSTEFYYFRTSNENIEVLPPNVKAIPYQPIYAFNQSVDYESNLAIEAANLGSSARGLEFDIIDVPDYRQYAAFLRPAFEHHNIPFKSIALALHGLISTTIELNWPGRSSPVEFLSRLRKVEDAILNSVDIRYGMSKRYLSERSEATDLPMTRISPFSFFTPFPLEDQFEKASWPVDLNFIGRQEKRKGPDLFLDVAWQLDSQLKNKVNLIGQTSHSWDGISSTNYLTPYANNRLPKVAFLPSQDDKELTKTFQSRSITFLPSRYDSFNLLALESIFAGCPTVVGDGAGVCDFLDEEFPSIPYIQLHTKNIETSVPAIQNLIINYGSYRENLIEAVKKIKIKDLVKNSENEYSLKLAQTELKNDPKSNEWSKKIYNDVFSSSLQFQAAPKPLVPILQHLPLAAPTSPTKTARQTRRPRRTLKQVSVKLLQRTGVWPAIRKIGKKTLREKIFNEHSDFLVQIGQLRNLNGEYDHCNRLIENNTRAIELKVKNYWHLTDHCRLSRVRTYAELASLEFKLGHIMSACSYELRKFRLNGKASSADLTRTADALKSVKLDAVADVVQIMFHEDEKTRSNLEFEYLQNRKKALLSIEPVAFEIFDDVRSNAKECRVSIIVSLFNAATKLPFFLKEIKKQTLFKTREIELIFVDSGSPSDEYKVFQDLVKGSNVPALYVRTSNRETIQTAWNRGIPLARGKYLSFLGVDETLKSDACEILMNELDQNPTIDWVMASSLITNVDMQGNYVSDVMLYDRSGMYNHMHYLECCYLSYVGGMYKKDIHEKFGYYDGSYRAAGDTEFKNRIIPFIKIKEVKGVLGKFLDYPEERTTASALAELEDLCAWYLHRTLGGVRYAFQNYSGVEAIEKLFWQALLYRKSYRSSTSTDVEYATNLLKLILERDPNHQLKICLPLLNTVLNVYRSVDNPASFDSQAIILNAIKGSMKLKKVAKKLNQLTPYDNIQLNVLNDNRYEQHNWNWKF